MLQLFVVDALESFNSLFAHHTHTNAQIKVDKDGAVDYRANSSYKSLREKSIEAASEFAKTKTLKEQQEYLPIFNIKDQLMQVVQDNQSE